MAKDMLEVSAKMQKAWDATLKRVAQDIAENSLTPIAIHDPQVPVAGARYAEFVELGYYKSAK